LELFQAHACHVLGAMKEVLRCYNSQRFKRLRLKTDISRQKAYHKIVSELTAGDRGTLIVWGDASFLPGARASPAVPTARLSREVSHRVFKLFFVDEFRTSKLSACCHRPLESAVNPETGKVFWQVRLCGNNTCPRIYWDRNVSAAINILYLFLEFAEGRPRPAPFRRAIEDEEEGSPSEATGIIRRMLQFSEV
jgi:hypothetical protein